MPASLKGKSVIVTGGSKGIGKGIARVFAGHGAKVLIVARQVKDAVLMAIRPSHPFCGVVLAYRHTIPNLERSKSREP